MDINSTYEVIFSDSARVDLEEIYSNISTKATDKIMKEVEENVLRLEKYPYWCNEIKVKPHKEKYRKLVIEDYIALYLIDEDYKQVVIHSIVYGNSDYLL